MELSARKDLHVILTNKSKKMMVVKVETYEKMISAYTKDAEKVDEHKVRLKECHNNGHVSSLLRSLKIGDYNQSLAGPNEDRMKGIKSSL